MLLFFAFAYPHAEVEHRLSSGRARLLSACTIVPDLYELRYFVHKSTDYLQINAWDSLTYHRHIPTPN